MESEGVRWHSGFGKSGVPRHLLRFWDQFDRRSGQRRRVQRLADLTGCLRTACVMV